MDDKFISPQQLAEYLGMPYSALAQHRKKGTGPKYLKIGHLVRYRMSDIENWLQERKETPIEYKKSKKTTTHWKCYKRMLDESWIKSLKSDVNLCVTDTCIPGLQMRFYHDSGHISFYLAYTAKNTRIQRNLFLGKHCDFKLEEIRRRAMNFRQQVSDGKDPFMDIIIEREKQAEEYRKRIKISKLLDLYFQKHCMVYKKPNTQRSDSFIIKYIKSILGNLYITELDLPKLIDFYQRKVAQTSFSTANHYIALISNFWNWCETYNYLPLNSNPCRKIPKGKNKKTPVKPLTLDEYKRLLQAIEDGFIYSPYHPRMFRALKVLMLTGCRTTEITKLKKVNVDLENGFIYLTESKNNEEKHPLGQPAINELRIALQEAPNDSEYVFPATRSGPNTLLDLRKAHRWALERAGLPNMRKHDYRHSFVSIGTDTLGMPIQTVSKTIGHADIATTAIYSHISDKTRLETANRIALAITGQ